MPRFQWVCVLCLPWEMWPLMLYFPKQVGFTRSKENEGFSRALLHFQHQLCSMCPGPDASQAPQGCVDGDEAHSFAPHPSAWCSHHLQQLRTVESIAYFGTSLRQKESHRLDSWLPTCHPQAAQEFPLQWDF